MQVGRFDTALKQATLVGLLLVTTGSGLAFAASFDCKKAKTKVEKTICADLRLSELDEELAAAFRDALRDARQPEKAELRKKQTAWLKARNGCKDKLCTEVMYRTRLAILAAVVTRRKPEDAEVPPATSFGRFWLTYGVGVEVCEAYLERLNRSSYEHHPRCDRSENIGSARFQPLGRTRLSVEEIQPFWPSVHTFLASGQVQDWKRGDEELRRLGLAPRFGSVKEQLETLRSESTLAVFRFKRPVDINNDAVPDRIMIWRTGSCGRFGALDEMRYWQSIPLVLNAAGDGPDVERTRELFGHPSGGYQLSSGGMATEFRPIGKSMGIFQFDGTYYMDTFFDGPSDNCVGR